MKVIDLFNMISNGEEVPKKIQVYNDIFVLDDGNKLYKNEKTGTNLLRIYNGNILNYEVKIIEEDKKIKKYDTGLTNGRYTEDSIKTGLDTDITIENIIINMGIEITLVKEKMFEIIDKINNMEVK